MTFDITKVCYKPSKELLGQEVYFSQYLHTLEEIVTEENGVYKGCVIELDKEGSIMPFCVSGIWTNYIYPIGEKIETVSPKYRPFESVRELVTLWDSMVVCNRPSNTMPLIWVKYKDSNTIQMITAFADTGVEMGATYMSWDFLFEKMTFLDNTPCGVKIS